MKDKIIAIQFAEWILFKDQDETSNKNKLLLNYLDNEYYNPEKLAKELWEEFTKTLEV